MAKLNYEKLAELEQRIKEGEAKVRELYQKANEDRSYSPVLVKAVSNLDGLKKEREKLLAQIYLNREPDRDPRTIVAEKYANMGRHNRIITLLHTIIKQIEAIQKNYAEIAVLRGRPVNPDGTVYLWELPDLEALKFNLTRQLSEMKPVTRKDFDREMKEAEALITRLQQKAEQEERIKAEVAML